jgi:hypothetical protein
MHAIAGRDRSPPLNQGESAKSGQCGTPCFGAVRAEMAHACTAVDTMAFQVSRAVMRSESPGVSSPEKSSAFSTWSRCSSINVQARSTSPALAAARKS